MGDCSWQLIHSMVLNVSGSQRCKVVSHICPFNKCIVNHFGQFCSSFWMLLEGFRFHFLKNRCSFSLFSLFLRNSFRFLSQYSDIERLHCFKFCLLKWNFQITWFHLSSFDRKCQKCLVFWEKHFLHQYTKFKVQNWLCLEKVEI